MTPESRTTVNKRASKPKAKRYVTTGEQLPIRVELPTGGRITYTKKGEPIEADKWPVPHVTIPNAIRRGLIEEVS